MSGRFVAKSVALAVLTAIFFGNLAATVSAITVYDRNAAVAYANANYNKVVSDGYFYATSYPATDYGAGQPVPTNVTGDDCAHFVSSVLGTPAGGLTIPNRAGTYGEPGAARLDELLVGNSLGGYGTTYKYGVLVSSVSQLTPGDVIGYNWGAFSNGDMSTIDHTAVYVGNNQIDCHSNSRLGANW
ncbi:MAG TPA: amidase domain-containing protein, partial [Lacipirellulaceae bacterium]|nr:amidase domain-containing protein [Lacipirellulaceae bacterium]